MHHVPCTIGVDLLIRSGCNTNAQTAQGYSALMVAVQRKQLDCLERILESGISSIDLQNVYGSTALIIATQNSNYDMMKLLREHGALL